MLGKKSIKFYSESDLISNLSELEEYSKIKNIDIERILMFFLDDNGESKRIAKEFFN